jgi:hypothetical protein
LLEAFDLFWQIGRFIEVVSLKMVQKHIPIDTANGNLGTEFHRRSDLASHNRSHMRSSKTDNALLNATLTMLIHSLLLAKQLADNE